MPNFLKKMLHYIYGLPALLISASFASFLCLTAAICYLRGQSLDSQTWQAASLLSFIQVLYALPGLVIFLLWTKNMDGNGRLSDKHYRAVCLTLDAPLCAALVAMSSMTTFLLTGNWRILVHAEQSLIIFASVGFFTAIFHWLLCIHWKSITVTLTKESAKKELYSQF
ncbi:MAG: hypothetical protein K0R10_2208 [Alphaproteobacteria bacterium]|jgi:hypothetical protein|nr:hypothetical protein [Alphaproteobacteria bacterium]